MEQIALFLFTGAGLSCEIPPGLPSPEYAYNDRRKQYDAKGILEKLSQRKGPSKIIGVANVDLYVPILKYVFGLAQVGGTSTVLSTYRLHPCFYEAPPDEKLFLDRIRKTTLHELGHSFGLTHCRSRQCVMFSSTRISDTDRKNDFFCPTCAELFLWYAQKECIPIQEECLKNRQCGHFFDNV